MSWLDERRGYLSDWVTQRWVQLMGRRVDLDGAERWLDTRQTDRSQRLTTKT